MQISMVGRVNTNSLKYPLGEFYLLNMQITLPLADARLSEIHEFVQMYANLRISTEIPQLPICGICPFFPFWGIFSSPLFIVFEMEERKREERNGKKRGGAFGLNYLKIVVGAKRKREKKNSK